MEKLVEINLANQSIRLTREVSYFVRFEMSFAIASNDTINRLIEAIVVMNDRMNKTNLCQKKGGEEVFIKSGTFKDFNAVFERYDGDQSAVVLENFLRDQQRVKIKAEMIS